MAATPVTAAGGRTRAARILRAGGTAPLAAEGFADIGFDAFHRERLPVLLARGRGRAAARAVRDHGSLGFRLPSGEAWTYVPTEHDLEVRQGDAGADTLVQLDLEAWQGLVHDYETAPGLLYAGRVRCLRGQGMRFVGWEPGLRHLYTGRPIYDPAALRLCDRRGVPLDPGQEFRPDDDVEEMAHFLRTAGYLLVRGVFGPGEAEALRAEALELRREARPGDRLSWWARDDAGEDVCCRVTRGADKPALAALPADPRLARLFALADEPLEHRPGEGNGVTVIYKSPGVSEGLSDLPWHRDCGMGGHAVMCPLLIASVFLSPASPDSGELRFLPGSWTHTCGFMEAGDRSAPRGVGFEARPGDVSIHYGDVMHAAPPPRRADLDAYRISATVGYARPGARHHGDARSYNDVLHQREDGRIEHLARVADRA